MSLAWAIRTLWTVWPLMSMPRICRAFCSASAGPSASLTPPALPRCLAPYRGLPLGLKPRRDLAALLGRGRDPAPLHGYSVLCEEFLRLMLEQVHSGPSLSAARPAPSLTGALRVRLLWSGQEA